MKNSGRWQAGTRDAMVWKLTQSPRSPAYCAPGMRDRIVGDLVWRSKQTRCR